MLAAFGYLVLFSIVVTVINLKVLIWQRRFFERWADSIIARMKGHKFVDERLIQGKNPLVGLGASDSDLVVRSLSAPFTLPWGIIVVTLMLIKNDPTLMGAVAGVAFGISCTTVELKNFCQERIDLAKARDGGLKSES